MGRSVLIGPKDVSTGAVAPLIMGVRASCVTVLGRRRRKERATAMRGLPGFWVACRGPHALSDPLTVSVPGLGEALAVFCFEEEARLYVGYRAEGLRPYPVGPGELVELLLGPWSCFDRITLDPMPGRDTDLMLRLASTHRDDFLDHVVHKYGLGRRAYDGGPPTPGRGRHNPGYARPDTGLVGGPPAPE
jgi:hypothetical protein